jgi:hypothetical protein
MIKMKKATAKKILIGLTLATGLYVGNIIYNARSADREINALSHNPKYAAFEKELTPLYQNKSRCKSLLYEISVAEGKITVYQKAYRTYYYDISFNELPANKNIWVVLESEAKKAEEEIAGLDKKISELEQKRDSDPEIADQRKKITTYQIREYLPFYKMF